MPPGVHQVTSFDKPYFPISMRLLRVVSILIQKYHSLLVGDTHLIVLRLFKIRWFFFCR